LHSDTKAEKKPSKFTVKDSILYSAVDGIQDEETEPMEAKVSTFVEEQQRLKEEFRKVSGEESGEDEDLFALKESRDVEEKEIQVDPAVQAYFDRVEADGDAEETKFLRAYISKELWKTRTNDLNPHPSFSDDEDEIERQDQFEASFNFRFEEPNSNKIVTYPRNVEDSLRKTSSKRSEARRRKQERKKAELEEKLEELKKIKRLKEKNLNEKAKIVQSVAGSSELDFERLLDGDFDPETFDQQMASVFDDKFYQAQDDASEDIIENPLGGIDSRGQEEEEDTSDFVDKKVLLEELRLAKKEFDEALNMDASDLTEDPEQKAVKFNYIPVPATDFGIPTKAILELEDSKLNQMVSLKKLAPYREDRNHISNKTWKELWKDQKQKYKEFKRKHGQLGVSEKNKSKKAKKSN
jgi:protein KRI1